MSGLLGRLAAHAAGAPPAVRPRPRSRFEPLPGAGAGAGAEHDLTEIDLETTSGFDAGTSAVPSPRHHGATADDSRIAERRSPASPSHPPAQILTETRAGGEESSQTPGRVAPVQTAQLPDAAGPSTLRPIELRAAHDGAEGRPSPAPNATVEVDDRVRSSWGSVALQPPALSDGARRSAESQWPADRRQDQPDVGRLNAPDGGLAAAQVRRRPEPSDAARNAPEAAAPLPPDIHIAIGRVEVRAPAPPPAPAPRAAATTPGLSLTDYLGARSSGRRR